jgi:hypothetical protein
MQIDFITTKKLGSSIVLTGELTTQLSSVLMSSPSSSVYKYHTTIVPPLTQPAKKLTIVLIPKEPMDIIEFTIKACTGNFLL